MLGSLSQLNNMSYKIGRESIEVQVQDEATANRELAALKQMDTVTPGKPELVVLITVPI